MPDRESMRQPAPSHECHEFSGSGRNTNRTFVAVRREGTWLHPAILVLRLPARRMRVPEARETGAHTEPYKVPGLHFALHRETTDLSSSDSRLGQPTRIGRLSHSLCPRLEILGLKPRNKWGRGSHIHAPA